MTMQRSADEAKQAGVTYHLVPSTVWDARKSEPQYVPEAYDVDGFIHCTNGLDQLLEVANMFYKTDSRPYTVLVLHVADIMSPVRYDDANEIFPHIYGPLNTSAVRGQLTVDRASDGTFIGFRHSPR